MPGVADGGALSDLLRAQAVCPVRAVQGRAVCRNAVAFGALVSAGCGCGCWSGLRRDFRTLVPRNPGQCSGAVGLYQGILKRFVPVCAAVVTDSASDGL